MTAAIPELLSPAGHWAALEAAVANGADAVYFGVEGFNARMRAANFRRSELAEIMGWLHARGVKAYLAMNVPVFSDELEQAASQVLEAAAAGVAQAMALACRQVVLARELSLKDLERLQRQPGGMRPGLPSSRSPDRRR